MVICIQTPILRLQEADRVLSYQSASQSIANYTSNQHTAMYHKEI